MRNNSGMSLIQLIIALGVASVMIIMMAHLSTSTFGMFQHIEKASMASDTFEEVKASLMSQKQCTLNLKGVSLSMNSPTGGAIDRLRNFDKDGNPTGNIAVTGVENRGLIVRSLRLRPVAKVDATLTVANLRMTFQKAGVNKTGPGEFQRDLPIYARTQNDLVTECWGRKDQGTAEANQVCVTISGGALDTFDIESGKCVLGNGEWFDGTPTSASCPAGTLMSPFARAETNCEGRMPEGFVDPFPPTNVTMTDGSTQKAMRPFVLRELNGSTCTCDWAQDLPAATIALGKCRILCIKP